MYYEYKNIKTYYEKHGNKNKVILILPGWGYTRPTFIGIINYFKNNYTIYILDYPGLGESPIPEKNLTIYDYTNIIRNFIKDNNITNPIIIAHSFGGRISTLLTGYYKEKIDKQILIDIAGIKPKKSILKKLKEKTYKLLRKLLKLLPKLKRTKYEQLLIQLFGSSDYKNLNPIMQQTFKNIVNEDLTKYYKNIETDTLIIWGKKDIDTPLADGLKINKLIKESAIITYPYATHFSYLNYPYLTNKIIEEFIK